MPLSLKEGERIGPEANKPGLLKHHAQEQLSRNSDAEQSALSEDGTLSPVKVERSEESSSEDEWTMADGDLWMD